MSKVKKSKDVVKIQVYCYTGFTKCNHNYIFEIDEVEWKSMNEEEKNDFLNRLATDNMSNHIDYGAEVMVNDDENND